MDTITFDKLLLNTAFCCMACDGNIDPKEIELIKSMCSNSPNTKKLVCTKKPLHCEEAFLFMLRQLSICMRLI